MDAGYTEISPQRHHRTPGLTLGDISNKLHAVQPLFSACKLAVAVQSHCLARSVHSPAITSSITLLWPPARQRQGDMAEDFPPWPSSVLALAVSHVLPQSATLPGLASVHVWLCAGGLSLSLQWKQATAPTVKTSDGNRTHKGGWEVSTSIHTSSPIRTRGQESPLLLTLSSAQPFPGFWAGWKVLSKPTAPFTLR